MCLLGLGRFGKRRLLVIGLAIQASEVIQLELVPLAITSPTGNQDLAPTKQIAVSRPVHLSADLIIDGAVSLVLGVVEESVAAWGWCYGRPYDVFASGFFIQNINFIMFF